MVSSIARARVVFHTTTERKGQKVIPRNETKGGRKKECGCKKPHRAYLLRRITRSAIRICRLPKVLPTWQTRSGPCPCALPSR